MKRKQLCIKRERVKGEKDLREDKRDSGRERERQNTQVTQDQRNIEGESQE